MVRDFTEGGKVAGDGRMSGGGERVGGGVPWREAAGFWTGQGAMDDQIGVAPDGAGKMGVVGFGESVVSDGGGGVTGAFEGAQEMEFKDVMFGGGVQFAEQFLDFVADGGVAHGQAVGENHVAEGLEFFRFGILMDPVEGGDAALGGACGHVFVGQEHAFLNQLVGDVVFLFFDPDRLACGVAMDLEFGKVEVQGALFKTLFPEAGGDAPEVAEQFLDKGVVDGGIGPGGRRRRFG